MKNQHLFTKPPHALRRANPRLDNFSIVPASALEDMAIYQALTDRQPSETAVMVLSASSPLVWPVYAAIARVLKHKGKAVKFYSAQ